MSNLVAAVREIGRGLGFMSGLVDQRSWPGQTPYLTPALVKVKSPWEDNHYFTFFQPINAFDSLLQLGHSSIPELLQSIISFPPMKDANYSMYLDRFERIHLRKVSMIHEFMATGKPKIATAVGMVPLVMTSNNLSEYCNLQVRTTAGDYRLEFAMGSVSMIPGKVLQYTLRSCNTERVFGPRTLAIFEKLGYAIRTRLYSPSFEIVANYGADFEAMSRADPKIDVKSLNETEDALFESELPNDTNVETIDDIEFLNGLFEPGPVPVGNGNEDQLGRDKKRFKSSH